MVSITSYLDGGTRAYLFGRGKTQLLRPITIDFRANTKTDGMLYWDHPDNANPILKTDNLKDHLEWLDAELLAMEGKVHLIHELRSKIQDLLP